MNQYKKGDQIWMHGFFKIGVIWAGEVIEHLGKNWFGDQYLVEYWQAGMYGTFLRKEIISAHRIISIRTPTQ